VGVQAGSVGAGDERPSGGGGGDGAVREDRSLGAGDPENDDRGGGDPGEGAADAAAALLAAVGPAGVDLVGGDLDDRQRLAGAHALDQAAELGGLEGIIAVGPAHRRSPGQGSPRAAQRSCSARRVR
jgi:hypothetical protein